MGRKHGATRKRAVAKQPSRRRSNRLASLARDRGNGGAADTDDDQHMGAAIPSPGHRWDGGHSS
jgi:hypothetical protein